jgi:hypothetical protein
VPCSRFVGAFRFEKNGHRVPASLRRVAKLAAVTTDYRAAGVEAGISVATQPLYGQPGDPPPWRVF